MKIPSISNNFLSKVKNDFLHLIFPNSCLVCENELVDFSASLCPICMSDLQFTYFERYQEPTILDQLFWGRVEVFATYSLLFFEKQKQTQKILHALKYKNKPDVGRFFGRMIGTKIIDNVNFSSIEGLIFVPLHSKREFVRGYNQSEKLAEGISEVIGKPVLKNYLVRTKNTKSQTKIGRFSRWDNMSNIFKVSKKNSTYKHIAIIDDVITTGSTLESIIRTIKENNPELRVSVISLALAK